MSAFRIFGLLLVGIGLLSLLAVAANVKTASLGGHDLSPAIAPSVFIIVVGVGLLLHHRWAAAIFAVISLGAGVAMGIGSLVTVPMPWSLINLGLAALIVLPAIVVIRRWSQLAPGRKFSVRP
jgi:hypothetical protein